MNFAQHKLAINIFSIITMSGGASQPSGLETLDGPLQKHPALTPIQSELIQTLRGLTDHDVDMSTYFECCSKHVQSLLLGANDGPRVESHLDIALIARNILSGAAREEVFRDIADAVVFESIAVNVNYSIDMCASLLAMTEVEDNGHDGLSGITALPWEKGPLSDALACYFSPQTTLQSDRPKLSKVFTARNLCRIAGIEIRYNELGRSSTPY